MLKVRSYILTGLALFITGILVSCALTPSSATEDVHRIEKDDLKVLLGNPDVIILDVRTSSQWNQSPYKIQGAQRLDHSNADQIEKMYPKDKTLVVYCS